MTDRLRRRPSAGQERQSAPVSRATHAWLGGIVAFGTLGASIALASFQLGPAPTAKPRERMESTTPPAATARTKNQAPSQAAGQGTSQTRMDVVQTTPVAAVPAAQAAPNQPKPPAPQQAEQKTDDERARDQRRRPPEYVLAGAGALNLDIPSADIKHIRDARSARRKQGIVAVERAREKVSSQAARDLLTWYIASDASRRMTPKDLQAFAKTHTGFPRRSAIRRHAEIKLLLSKAKAPQIMSYFGETLPISGEGYAALARSAFAQGKNDEGKKHVALAWRGYRLSPTTEEAILKEFKDKLTTDDHLARADFFLLNDSRWRGTRNRRAQPVRRMIKRLDKENAAIVKARLSVYLKQRGARKLFAKIPKERRTDWSVVYHQIQLHRRAKKYREAWKLMLTVPDTAEAMIRPDGWWIERRVNAYEALNSGEPQIAYDIVSRHGPVSVNSENEAEFMSGWIALRFLKKPETALEHFQRMTKSADGPRTRGQSHYWLARTLKALKRPDEAEDALRLAAREFNTFYGQVARQTLDPDANTILIRDPAIPLDEDITRFLKRPGIRAMIAAWKAGDRTTTRRFIAHLRYHLRDERELGMLAETALQMGDTQMSLRVGKAAMLRGLPLAKYAYPVGALPDYTPLREPLEEAFLYAIARQESEFNTLIQSGAGARGILQVMPITARHICRQYRIKCAIKKLKTDPSYNTRIASAYIADRNSDFGGSYVMTMPGYNAGPGRVRGWVRRNGDPRRPEIDPIDWIERLHIKETREYTKKVLANIQIYRARLGQGPNALRIWDDIMRARKGDKIVSAPRLPRN